MAVKWALADSQTEADETLRSYVRYISLYNIHPDDRDSYIATINFTLNSLNGGKFGLQKRVITHVGIVPGTDKTLLKVRLDFYAIDPQDWDELGRKGSGPLVSLKKLELPDPYFHIQIKKRVAEKIRKTKIVKEYDNRGFYVTKEKEYFVEGEAVEKVELAHAPWLEGKDIVALCLAVQSDFPILRGDWFVSNALINPAYSRFLGIQNIQDIHRIARFRNDDVDLAEKGIVTESQEVALHMRAARRTPTSSGYYWDTFDYFHSIDENDLLTDLLKEKRDAGEIIFTLPNTLQAYALVDGKDKVIDFADPNVAIDTQTIWRNKLVWSGVSCITCHTKGIKTVTDEVRLLARPNVALLVKKKKDFEAVVQLYSTPIDEAIQKDQAVYSRAIKLSTGGLTAEVNAANVQRFFVGYLQNSITLEIAAMEIGQTPDAIIKMIERLEQPDHTLTQLYARRPVRRDQWESTGFSQLMTLPFEKRK